MGFFNPSRRSLSTKFYPFLNLNAFYFESISFQDGVFLAFFSRSSYIRQKFQNAKIFAYS
jgi:hypothetical protein